MRWTGVLVVVLVAACVGAEALAAARASRCRVLCRGAIEACTTRAADRELSPDLTPRARRRAVKQLRKRCKSGLVAACKTSPGACASVTTTTTTVPGSTTTTPVATTTSTTVTRSTTTLAPDAGVSGHWRFEGDGSEDCSGFESHEAVSFRVQQFGSALAGTWFPDESAVGSGSVTGPGAFTFALEGTARHLLCVLTALSIEVEGPTHATLSATAECPEGTCSGEWTGTLVRLTP